jgi:quercetin dioxygenase-like cupin family protein
MNAFRCAGLFILLATVLVSAQVPTNKEPHHRTVFENAQFRILDVNVPPGETTLEHSHQFDIVTVSMTSGTETRVQSPGQPWTNRPRRALGNVQTTEYSGKPASHRVETVGSSPYHLFAVENLKASGWSAAPALSAGGTTRAAESRSFLVYNVSLGKDRSQTSHTHTVPTLVVLLSGKVMSEGPDEKAKANAPAPVGLKQMDRPGQWVLVPAGDSHHLVRLGTDDGQLVEIEVR